MALRWRRSATSPVVPAPPKGSSTVPPGGQPALMHGSISAGGKVAKWACGKGEVATVQTERLLRPLPYLYSFPLSLSFPDPSTLPFGYFSFPPVSPPRATDFHPPDPLASSEPSRL